MRGRRAGPNHGDRQRVRAKGHHRMDSRMEAPRLAHRGKKTRPQSGSLAHIGRVKHPPNTLGVRGHAGDPDNERCDEIAQAFSRGDQPELLVPETKP